MEANRKEVDPSFQELIEGSTIAGEISSVNHTTPCPSVPPIEEGRDKLIDDQKRARKMAADRRYREKKKGLAAKRDSDYKALRASLDEITLEVQNQSVKRAMNEKKTEWVMLITSILLEAMSAVFDQVGYALMGMVIAFLALFLSSVYLICKPRKEGVERSHPSGGLLEYYGLAASVWQCFYSTMEYLYTRKNQQNPLKICLLPFMFALFVLLFSLFKCRT